MAEVPKRENGSDMDDYSLHVITAAVAQSWSLILSRQVLSGALLGII